MRLCLLLLLLLFTGSLPGKAIEATVSRALFYQADNNGHSANILISWRAVPASLHYTRDAAGKWSSSLKCVLSWYNDSGMIAQNIFKLQSPPGSSPEDAQATIIGDQYATSLPPGKYRFEVLLFDAHISKQAFEYRDSLTVPPFPEDSLRVSMPQLLDTSLIKGSDRIDFPLSSNFVGDEIPVLHYYFETYRGRKFKPKNPPYFAKIYISSKPYASPIPGYETSDSLSKNFGGMHYGSFPLDRLQSGNYYLNVVLADKSSWVHDKQCYFFQRFNSKKTEVKSAANIAAPTTMERNEDSSGITHVFDLTTTFVGKYSPQQVKAILNMLSLIADPSESLAINGFLSKPDELYSKYFIYNFWEKRDSKNPEKAWMNYADKIREVNRNFSMGRTPGYMTDRGRIYIQYGKPNDRIIVNNENGSLPYEIWQYYANERNGLDGVFLFYKPARSFSGYELLHSTFPDEKRNMNWRALLYVNNLTSGNSNENSQAEQLIGNK